MRKEIKGLAVELARIKLQLDPLQKREKELRAELTKRLPLGEPEVVDGFLFNAYEKLNTTFDEGGLINFLGSRAAEVTIPKLSPDKLDAALKLGRVTPEELEPFTHVSTTKVLLVRLSNGTNGKKEKNDK